jgi:hypothetical protein
MRRRAFLGNLNDYSLGGLYGVRHRLAYSTVFTCRDSKPTFPEHIVTKPAATFKSCASTRRSEEISLYCRRPMGKAIAHSLSVERQNHFQ